LSIGAPDVLLTATRKSVILKTTHILLLSITNNNCIYDNTDKGGFSLQGEWKKPWQAVFQKEIY
jgi:hypothetical protein